MRTWYQENKTENRINATNTAVKKLGTQNERKKGGRNEIKQGGETNIPAT